MSARTGDAFELGPWERSNFAMTAEELAIHEALVAMQRLLERANLTPPARRAVHRAISELTTPPPAVG